MSSVDTSNLKSLGSAATEYKTAGADAGLLERFESSFGKFQPKNIDDATVGGYDNSVLITAPEFTSLCPKTGQPDFATIVIRYRPRDWLVESKSLKLYLGSFRQVGEFHESCVAKIARDLIDLLDPDFLEVEGQFTPRGGIPFWPRVRYSRGARDRWAQANGEASTAVTADTKTGHPVKLAVKEETPAQLLPQIHISHIDHKRALVRRLQQEEGLKGWEVPSALMFGTTGMVGAAIDPSEVFFLLDPVPAHVALKG